MPWTGEHGDDADDDLPVPPPLPPDDRLWRHPSELGWSSPSTPVPVPPPPRQASPPRLWAIALTSGLTGAALALGIVALVGGLAPVRERVIERVPLPIVDDATTEAVPERPQRGPTAVADSVMPSIVRIDVLSPAGRSSGSGVVIRDDGTILTNAHVVAEAIEVVAVLPSGTTHPAAVVGQDPLSDIAVIAVDDPSRGTWVPAVLGSADDLEVGQEMVAIGSALGLSGPPSVTVGIVSALGQRVSSRSGTVLHDMIQTDAAIARGSSGGALCDERGVVVGITTAYDVEGGSLGFATPIDVAKDVADDLLADGRVHNPWIGIEGADVAGDEGGVEVHHVTPDGPAALGGVLAGDVILAMDGVRLRTMSDLVVALRRLDPGQLVTLQLDRDGAAVTLTVTLAERAG